MELSERVLPRMGALFSVHVSSANVVSMASGTAQVVALNNLDMNDHTVREFPRFAHENPALQFLISGGCAPVLRIADFISERKFLDTGLYQEIYRPFDGRHQMSLMVEVEGFQWGYALFRDKAFSDDEAFLFSQLRAHMARGLTGASVPGSSPDRDVMEEDGVTGFISMDANGTPTLITELAEAYLQKYFGKTVGVDSKGLPDDLARWVAASLRVLRSMGVTTVPDQCLSVPSVGGRLDVRLVIDRQTQAFWLRLKERRLGLDFLELQKAGLTRRECEVLFWVSQGKRDAEIATILDVAVKTAGKHMENILAKLGCETRTAAVRVAGDILRTSR